MIKNHNPNLIQQTIIKQQEKLKQAEQFLDKAFDLRNNEREVWLNRYIIYLERKEYKKAIKACNQILAKNSKNDIAYAYRGFCMEKTNNKEKAQQDYQQSLMLNPYNKLANYYLDTCRKGQNE